LFSVIDLGVGAIGIRLSRRYRKIRKIPDVVFVKDNLGFGGVTSYSELEKIQVSAVLDLRQEAPDESLEKFSLEYTKIGIPDGEIPTDSQLSILHKFIEEKLNLGKTLFIHCNLGRGRATLVTLSYLLYKGMDFESAMKLVRIVK